MIKEAIARLVKKEDLTADQMNDVMEEIMTCLLYTSQQDIC